MGQGVWILALNLFGGAYDPDVDAVVKVLDVCVLFGSLQQSGDQVMLPFPNLERQSASMPQHFWRISNESSQDTDAVWTGIQCELGFIVNDL